MAVKTFTSATLSSSDTNEYLANAGLVYVKSQTVGTGVSTVTVSDCFSATYDDYRITISGVVFSSPATSWQLRVGGATADYYGSSYYDFYGGGGTGTLRSAAAPALYFGVADNNNTSATFDVCRPFTSTKITTFQGNFYGGGYSGFAAGTHAANTSHTSFTLISPVGNMTGGVITVFGYRKA